MHLREDIDDFLLTIPNGVTVVAATKYVGTSEMLELYQHGIIDFGDMEHLALQILVKNLPKKIF